MIVGIIMPAIPVTVHDIVFQPGICLWQIGEKIIHTFVKLHAFEIKYL